MTPTATATPAGNDSGGDGGTAGGSAQNESRPEFTSSLLRVGDISTDAEVLVTNFILALILLMLVLFDASIINSTLEENSDFFDGLMARISGPLGPPYAAASAAIAAIAERTSRFWKYIRPALVLTLTAIVYALLEPGVGFNQQTFVLLVSLLVGIAITTYASDGTQVWIAERRFGIDAQILFYPFAILVALASVIVSRLVDLHPGVIYGFVAAATLTGAAAIDRRTEGQIIYLSTLILLGVALLCWFMVSPLREWSEDGGLVPALLETVAVAVFVGSIQSVVFTLIPLDFLDGQKIWNWSRLAWISLALPVTFIFLHVILNPNGDFDSPVQETALQALLIACVVLWGVTAAIWLFFRQKRRMQAAGG